jgi:DNA-binding transcriptional LysR family regulator
MSASTSFDWDDLKHFLAVARHGSTLAAGRALGVDQSTVLRRVAELERALGRELVLRSPTGYRLTPFGESLRPLAEQVERAAAAVAAAGDAAQGVVRVTCPEPIVQRLVQSELLARFHARYPDLQVVFVSGDRYADLMAGEADIALRSGDTDDGELLGRKIADSLWAVYASRGYVERHGRPSRIEELASHALIGLHESMASHRVSSWLQQVAPQGRVVARTHSILGLVHAAKAGLGVAPLPYALGEADPELVRLLGPIDELKRIWRVLVAPDRRHAPQVAAFFDFVVAEVEALRPILSG